MPTTRLLVSLLLGSALLLYLAPGGEVDPTGDRPARHRALLVRWREESGLPRVD